MISTRAVYQTEFELVLGVGDRGTLRGRLGGVLSNPSFLKYPRRGQLYTSLVNSSTASLAEIVRSSTLADHGGGKRASPLCRQSPPATCSSTSHSTECACLPSLIQPTTPRRALVLEGMLNPNRDRSIRTSPRSSSYMRRSSLPLGWMDTSGSSVFRWVKV